jgi:hypothetical protein
MRVLDGFTFALYVMVITVSLNTGISSLLIFKKMFHLSVDALNLNCLEPAEDGNFQLPLFISECWLIVAALDFIAWKIYNTNALPCEAAVCKHSRDLLGTFLVVSFVSYDTYALPLHTLNYTAYRIMLLHIHIGFSAFTTWTGLARPYLAPFNHLLWKDIDHHSTIIICGTHSFWPGSWMTNFGCDLNYFAPGMTAYNCVTQSWNNSILLHI